MTAQPDEQSAEQYLDALPDYKACNMDATPGFRAFVLDAMETIGERPRGGDLCSMHMAYKAGLENAAPASGWQDEKPGIGRWHVSLKQFYRGEIRNRAVVNARVFELDGELWVYLSACGPICLDASMFTGAKWKRRETPSDPFLAEVHNGK